MSVRQCPPNLGAHPELARPSWQGAFRYRVFSTAKAYRAICQRNRAQQDEDRLTLQRQNLAQGIPADTPLADVETALAAKGKRDLDEITSASSLLKATGADDTTIAGALAGIRARHARRDATAQANAESGLALSLANRPSRTGPSRNRNSANRYNPIGRPAQHQQPAPAPARQHPAAPAQPTFLEALSRLRPGETIYIGGIRHVLNNRGEPVPDDGPRRMDVDEDAAAPRHQSPAREHRQSPAPQRERSRSRTPQRESTPEWHARKERNDRRNARAASAHGCASRPFLCPYAGC